MSNYVECQKLFKGYSLRSKRQSHLDTVANVVVNNPTRGYGIFIENMMDATR